MSNKEMAAALLERVPEYKMGYAVAYLQGLVADEEADDEFCRQMVAAYEADPDKGDFMPLKDFRKELGLDVDAGPRGQIYKRY